MLFLPDMSFASVTTGEQQTLDLTDSWVDYAASIVTHQWINASMF